jgi:hypothetical protein
MFAYGLVSAHDFKHPDDIPPFDTTMEALGDMMDRLLTPEDGGNSEGGKVVIRQLAANARAQFDQMKQANDKKEEAES